MNPRDRAALCELLPTLFTRPDELVRLWAMAGLRQTSLPLHDVASMDDRWRAALDLAHSRGPQAMEALVGEALVRFPGNVELRRLYRESLRLITRRTKTQSYEETVTLLHGHENLPRHWGPYGLRCRLGSGATAHVFMARPLEWVDDRFGLGDIPSRLVAIKVMKDSYYGEDGAHLFHREMATLAAISHPNVISVSRSGTVSNPADGYPVHYIEME